MSAMVMSALRQKRTFAQSSLAVIRSVELIVQPDAHDAVGEMSMCCHGPGQSGKEPGNRRGCNEGCRGIERDIAGRQLDVR
jgi:hypothetical protein